VPQGVKQNRSPFDGLQFYGIGRIDDDTRLLTMSPHDVEGKAALQDRSRTAGSEAAEQCMNPVDEVFELFEQRGGADYGGERVSQLERALQCAALAEEAGADAALISTALCMTLDIWSTSSAASRRRAALMTATSCAAANGSADGSEKT
jgi:hypothetical protein